MTTFLTASEISRELSVPLNRITHAVEIGVIVPDGRAGKNTNSAIIFSANRLAEIKAAIATGTPATKPEALRDIAEVSAKAAAIHRAKKEAGK